MLSGSQGVDQGHAITVNVRFMERRGIRLHIEAVLGEPVRRMPEGMVADFTCPASSIGRQPLKQIAAQGLAVLAAEREHRQGIPLGHSWDLSN